ncbi:malonyl-CoA decarboxylase, mitochondrial [Orussus abietinus]|uniref:malonyl-CoA decarboxylase, mitochondrial n=1 Tax=Orussus abietinus TaxID=222816 RepID=UPI000624F80F|nr:malonyl-CoA decarboxylase, mitochondrial [Orussus abietinus]
MKRLILRQHFKMITRRCYCNTITPINEKLKEIFCLKNTNVSNWIIEGKVQSVCSMYYALPKEGKRDFLCTLAMNYAINHNSVFELVKQFTCIEPLDQKQIIISERTLRNTLTAPYYWLFVLTSRLTYGIKFLVDLRTDLLEFKSELDDMENTVAIQQLNTTLQDLLLLWFSVGFLHLERITWQSSCDMLQKVSDYEAIHPIRNWADLKRRVGPFRRCYVFTHPSMPGEPIVVLHVALCDTIPCTVKGIKEAEERILNNTTEPISFMQEDKHKIKAAIFYSIASTQKGLQGIELGNYMIKEVIKKVIEEFPLVNELSSLSPIPNFKTWLLEKIKQDPSNIFDNYERDIIQRFLRSDNLYTSLKKTFDSSRWTNDIMLTEILKEPLIRACARYLYREKRRNYALNSVANFHLRNGAVIWRINWMADPSPRGVTNSCGIMVNYRYFPDETESNSRNYIEKNIINASEYIIELASKAVKLEKNNLK